jgi:hypothetical protein
MPEQKVCPICGSWFQTRHKETQTCSRSCGRRLVYGPVDALFWAQVQRGSEDDCWPWLGYQDAAGYGRTNKCGEHFAHRVAWVLTQGQIPTGLKVLHTCDNPPCCNPAHLYLGTQLENMRDMVQRGRGGDHRGQRNGRARISESDVCRIRSEREMGQTQGQLAALFGVGQQAISRLLAGKSWGHVQCE